MRGLRVTVLVAALAAAMLAADKPQSFTGEVSDAMCGAKHMMGNAADCTRACVKEGSKYALVVGDQVYTLDANDSQKADLDKLAGEKATVTGTANGKTIAVESVKAAK